MTNKTLLSALFLFNAWAAGAQINWATDIAPILYKHCVKCHRDGGLGHFSLIGYDNAFSNRYNIQYKTTERQMPPWKPDPTYQHYTNENILSDQEIQRISDWVDSGAAPGNLADAPQPPVFSDISDVGVPDETLLTPYFTVTATDDEYRCFVIPNGLSQVAYLRGLEAIPGNHEVVHHILIYEDVSGQGRQLDMQTPEPGYVSFGGPGVNDARLIAAWVPGAQTVLTPPFMGVKLTPGADLIVQMHYPKGVTGMSDQTRLNLFFTPTNQGVREITLAPILNHFPPSLENYPLNIPANTVKQYHEKYTIPFPYTASGLAVAPHMHLIGRSIVCYGVTPQGDTLQLIRINDWDFHWQGAYYFQKVLKIPSGTVLHAYAVYDNTTNNPNQPSNPPQHVVQGEATTDEMMLVYFAYMDYHPGDENIVLDSSLLSTGLPVVDAGQPSKLQLFPNPAKDRLTLQFETVEKGNYRVSLTDVTGRIVRTAADRKGMPSGKQEEQIPVQDLPAGTYFIEVQTSNAEIFRSKFIKQ